METKNCTLQSKSKRSKRAWRQCRTGDTACENSANAAPRSTARASEATVSSSGTCTMNGGTPIMVKYTCSTRPETGASADVAGEASISWHRNMSSSPSSVLRVVQEDLYGRTLPFWLKHSPDSEFGGYFNCLDEDGRPYDTKVRNRAFRARRLQGTPLILPYAPCFRFICFTEARLAARSSSLDAEQVV